MYNGVYDIESFAYMHDTLLKWLGVKLSHGGLSEKLMEKGVTSLAVYGIRGLGEMAYEDLVDGSVKVSCFIDKRAGEYSDGYKGVPVISPDGLSKEVKAGYILITPELYFYDIMQDLAAAGVPYDNMITVSMFV